MAQRGIQLVRTDDSTSGVVKFYDRRQADVKKAFIGQVDVDRMLRQGLIDLGYGEDDVASVADSPKVAFVVRLAVHGATQNILDASNKLDGDERRDYIAGLAQNMDQNLVWASAPIDEAALKQRTEDLLAKLDPAIRAQLLAKYKAE